MYSNDLREATYFALEPRSGGRVPNVVRHFVTPEPEKVFLFDSVSLLTR